MARLKLGSSAQGKRVAKSVKHMRDSQIDFSEILDFSEDQPRLCLIIDQKQQLSYANTGNNEAIEVVGNLYEVTVELCESERFSVNNHKVWCFTK